MIKNNSNRRNKFRLVILIQEQLKKYNNKILMYKYKKYKKIFIDLHNYLEVYKLNNHNINVNINKIIVLPMI